jgi:hypothetical protein
VTAVISSAGASLGVAEDREVAVLALDRRAAGARPALVARLRDVLEVGAARALQQVAGDRGEVAQLPGRARQQRLGEQRVLAADERIGGQVAVAHRAADAQPAVGCALDRGVRQARDVDEVRGPLDAQPHEVDQVGATAEVADLRPRRCRHRGGGVGRALVGELPHRAACSIAATIPR